MDSQLVAVHLEAVQREKQLDAFAAEEGGDLALAAEVEHEKLEERVYHDGLVAIPGCDAR